MNFEEQEKKERELRNTIIKVSISAIVLLILIFSTVYQIDAGEKGVLLRFGAIQNKVAEEGLHFKSPFMDSVVKMNVKTQRYFRDGLEAASSDSQLVRNGAVTVNYHLAKDDEKIKEVYRAYRRDYEQILLFPAVEGTFKTATAKFRAEDLLRKRDELSSMMKEMLVEKMEVNGIIVLSIEINNLDFSGEFNAAIERKVVADQLAQEAEFKTRQITEEAKQAIERAKGEAEAVAINAQAEADAIKKKSDALAESPKLVEYEKALRWNGNLPQTMLSGEGALPFFEIK